MNSFKDKKVGNVTLILWGSVFRTDYKCED